MHNLTRSGPVAPSASGQSPKRRPHVLVLVVLALAIVIAGVAPAAAAGNGTPVERPYFEQTFVDIVLGACDTPTGQLVCQFTLEGYLIGTHIGRAADSGTGTATVDTSATCTLSNGAIGTPVVAEFSGVIVAADGSELFYEGVTNACFVTPGEADQTGTWWITGGTGRFDGATGTIDVDNMITDRIASNMGSITF